MAQFGFPRETIVIFLITIGFSLYMDLLSHKNKKA